MVWHFVIWYFGKIENAVNMNSMSNELGNSEQRDWKRGKEQHGERQTDIYRERECVCVGEEC